MVIQLGDYILDVDIEKNREIYKKLPLLTEGCDCPGCRNYVQAALVFSDRVAEFFNMLGVDARKTPEVFVNPDHCSDSVWYNGWYHLCGTILQGADSGAFYPVSDHFRIAFRENCELLSEEFSSPVFQMEIDTRIPWVLDESNSYLLKYYDDLR